MKIFPLLFICYLSLVSCNSSQKNETENDTIKTENDSLKNENYNWIGNWIFEDNAPVTYTLKIEQGEQNKFICNFDATGIQTFYNIRCYGVSRGNSFELYFEKLNEGVFYQEENLNTETPILTLKYTNGTVVTYWNQLINNYVEENNHSGQVCFVKE